MMRSAFFAISLAVMLIFSSCNRQEEKPKHLHLKIVETTDVHGSFFPENLVTQKPSSGSLSQVESWLRAERSHKNQQLVLLDNGDILQGSPVVYYANYIDTLRPHLLSRIMNFMHYDAASVGNHDIEAGPKVYEQFRSEIDFPYLAANAIDSSSGEPHFKPYTIIRRKGLRIAVIGLITPSIPNWLPEKLWPGMYFDDMVETAQYWIGIVKEKEKPDLIIGLFHAGVDATYGGASPDDYRNENASLLVAQKVPGFDVVFAGHDHKPLVDYIVNASGDPVLVLNAGSKANRIAVADIDLEWDEQTKSYHKDISGSLIPMENEKADSAFMQKFGSYFDRVKEYMNEEAVYLDTTIRAVDALFGPSAYTGMIHRIQLETSGADISFAAPFSTSAVLEKGPLYWRDMFKLYRYENFLCTLKLSGAEVRKFLEYSASLWFDSLPNDHQSVLLLEHDGKKDRYGLPLKNAYYNFDSGMGINYEIDLRKARGQRVKILSMADGTPFDENKIYTVVMNSYRANGGGNHLTKGAGLSKEEIKKRIIKCSDTDFRRIIKSWLYKQKHYKPVVDKNWKLLPEKTVHEMIIKEKAKFFIKD